MANYDAQINILVGGINKINDLENRLSKIQDTIEEINAMGAEGIFGRGTNLGTYSRALKEINATADAVRKQTAEQQQSNSVTREQILLYSRLNREQNLFRRRSAAFTEESRGVRETNARVIELTTQLRSAQKAFSTLFADADIEGVRVLNTEISALLEELREINRVATGTKNVGANTAQLRAQAEGWQNQINALKKRASALQENEEILNRIATAERNLIQLRNEDMSFRADANVRLGKQELANVISMIKAEESLASVRRRESIDYERQLNRQSSQMRSMIDLAAKALKAAGSATLDAVTFGKGSQVARGARNAAIRGGLGLGALGIGGAYAATQQAIGNIDLGVIQGPATQAAAAIGGAINNALGGVPEIIGNMLSALGDIPGALGLAGVAALAFAPAMKTAGDAVFLAGKKFGESKFGQNIKLTLDRQTNLFESVINAATEMNMVLDASKSGLDAVGQKIESLPMLPAAGQTSFAGEMRKGRGGAFMGGGAREIFNPEYLVTATGQMAQRTEMSAAASLLFAEGLGQAANEAKTIAEYLKEANALRDQGKSRTQQFIRQNIERGRMLRQNEQSAEAIRQRSQFLLGGQYSLAEVPARGELLPGGRTETRMPDYRQMLNNAATVAQLQQEILDAMSKQQGFAATIGQIERRTINDKGQSLKIQQDENAELERSIQIIRERNRELRARPLANMTPQERRAADILDPESLRVQREYRVKRGRKRQEKLKNARSEALVGGAFPLLFGQGLGGALGGGLGGFAGGMMGGGLGFGLSLLGTTIGGLFDQLGKAAEDAGKSLNYPIEGFNKLKEANLFASRDQEYYISKLIESGQTAKATGAIQAEIIKKVGISGMNDLMNLGDSSSRLSKAWAEFNLQLQAALAGPLGGLLDWLTQIVALENQSISSNRQANDISAGLTGEAKRNFDAEIARIGMSESIGRKFGPLFGGISASEANKQRDALSNFYAPFAQLPAPQKVKDDKAEQEAALRKSIEVADKIRGINEQGIALQRSADDLRLNIEDTVYGLRKRATDMEREVINFRRSIEDEIVGKRQELEKMIIDNDRARQQNAIDALDLQLQKASSGLDPIAQGVVDAAREYIRTRAEGEADLQQKERQLKLELQQIDQEVNKYKLQVEERVSQMSLQREEFTRDVSRTKLQTERQIGDYVISVEKYRLEMAKLRVDEAIREGKIAEAAAIARQQGLGVSPTGRNYANVGGFMGGRQMLHGIPGFAGYDAAHAGGNAHYHFAGQNPAETKAVADFLKGSGFKITEFGQYGQNVGRHAPGSQHYRAQGFNAFDVPGSQVPVGQEIPMMRRIHALVNDFLGTGGVNIAPTSLSQVPASKPLPTLPSAPTMPRLPATPQMIQVNDLMAQYRDLQKQIQEQMIKANATERESLAIKLEAARLQYENQVLAPIRQFEEENRQLQVEIENRKERNRLAAEGYSPEIIEGKIRVLELDRALNSVLAGQQKAANEQAVAAMKKLGLNTQLIDSTFNLTEATAAELLLTTQDTKKKEELRKELEQILKLKNDIAGKTLATDDNARSGIQQAAAASVMSPRERMQERIGTLNQEMAKLLDNTNLIIGAAESIGNAFSQSFTGVINRTMTAQEALGSFFQNVANYFLDMAGQILTKTIEIQSSKMLMNLFPSIFGFSRGGAFGMNGIQPFARGGIVTSPTLFTFANGGALQAGLMGEAGPEAIIPLKRGSGGRLGVEAFGSAPTNDQAGAGIDPFAENRMAMATAQDAKAKRESQQALSSGVPVTEIKYNRVGSGDLPFVTEETMLEATRAAIEQGAKLGQRRTIAVLRNDPSARRSVGL